jgi:2-aminoadipate transaminase
MQTTSTASFEDLLSSRARIGFTGRRPTAAGTVQRYDFGGGRPDPVSFPIEDLTTAFAQMMAEVGREALTYGEAQGYSALRELLVDKFRRHDEIEAEPDNFLITNGSSHALSLVISAFVDVGDPVICEAPTFSGTLVTLRRHGPDLIGIPVDDEGMRTDVLEERLNDLRRQGRRAKLIYTIVNFQNPAGPTMSLRRRHELLRLAAEHQVVVLEDDAYGELRWEGEPLPSLYRLDQNGLVARAGTVSKILGAGTRIGWILAPTAMIPHFQGFKFDGGTNPLVSRLVTYYLRGHMDEHIEDLIAIYHSKRDAMTETLEETLGDTDAVWSRPEGGFFIWMKLPTGGEAKRVVELATKEQVTVVPGMSFMPNGGGEDYIRLAFSYASVDDIREGVRRLGRAIKASL